MKIHVKMKFNKIEKTKYLIKFYDGKSSLNI